MIKFQDVTPNDSYIERLFMERPHKYTLSKVLLVNYLLTLYHNLTTCQSDSTTTDIDDACSPELPYRTDN